MAGKDKLHAQCCKVFHGLRELLCSCMYQVEPSNDSVERNATAKLDCMPRCIHYASVTAACEHDKPFPYT